MWQKNKSKHHLLLNYSNETCDGSFRQTACGDQIRSKKKNQSAYPPLAQDCEICSEVWHIAFTSVSEAISKLKNTTNVKVLDQVAILTNSTTLLKAIHARMRKLEKDKLRERKLRLIQQAYD